MDRAGEASMTPASPSAVPPSGARTFAQMLVNTAVANVTTSFLWFALTFWVYLETPSVPATGLVAGAVMVLTAGAAFLTRSYRLISA